MKILAVDPGTKRVGLSACDELELTTRLLPVLSVKKSSALVQKILELVREEAFGAILLGLPLNMDGTQGEGAKRSQKLADSLKREFKKEKLECEVILWDERLTSFEAETRLRERGVPKGKAKEYLDSLAAEVLLEDFLRSRS